MSDDTKSKHLNKTTISTDSIMTRFDLTFALGRQYATRQSRTVYDDIRRDGYFAFPCNSNDNKK